MKSLVKPTFASLLAMALLGAVVSAQAQTNIPKSAEAPAVPAKPKHETLPFHGKVSAVDKAAMTITLEGKEGKRTFEATSKTKITKDGKPATLADAAVGDKVGGAYKKGTDGKLDAVTLNFGEKAEKPKVEAPAAPAVPAAPVAPAKP